MKNETYNGWTNYETWLAYCWLTNDQETYNRLNRLTEAHKDKEAYQLADQIKEFVYDITSSSIELDQASLANDLLNGAISEIDFQEIAEHELEANSD